MNEREQSIADMVSLGGTPESVVLAKHGQSVAVALRINGIIETIEGCGATDAEMADDVIGQLRERLREE